MTTSLPASADDLTVEWLRSALPADLQPQRITGFTVEVIGHGEGFAGQLARVLPSADDGSTLPALIVKFAAEHETTRQLMADFGGYEHEVNFYNQLAGRVDLRTPRSFFAEFDREAGTFLIILEDLAPAVVGDQVVGATLEQAEFVMDELARHHARWWNSEELAEVDWLTPPEGFEDQLYTLFDRGMPALREQWGAGRPKLVAMVERTRALLPELLKRVKPGVPPKPYTLLHGDMRLDNLFFPSEEGGEFTVIDWQATALGPAGNELSYWLVLSLPVELRRAHEEALLRRYHEALVGHGVTGFSWRKLKSSYREGSIQMLGGIPILAGSLDFTSERGVALADASMDRVEAALDDHNAERMLRILPWALRGMDAWTAITTPVRRLRNRLATSS
jgi:hypothetical protein